MSNTTEVGNNMQQIHSKSIEGNEPYYRPGTNIHQPITASQTTLNPRNRLNGPEISAFSRQVEKAAYSKPLCEVCQKVFCNIYYLRRHMIHHHGIYNTSKITNLGLETFCILCCKKYSNKQAFLQHYIQHHGPNFFQCKRKTIDPNITITPKRFKTNSHRANPVHITEVEYKKYNGERNCDMCPQVFGSIYALKKHKIKQHLIRNDLDLGNQIVKPSNHFYPDRNSQRLIDSLIEKTPENVPCAIQRERGVEKNTSLPSKPTSAGLSILDGDTSQTESNQYYEYNNLCTLPKLPELIPISKSGRKTFTMQDTNEIKRNKDERNNENFCRPCQLSFSSKFFLNMHNQYKHCGFDSLTEEHNNKLVSKIYLEREKASNLMKISGNYEC